MDDRKIIFSVKDRIAYITLNRPDKRNALDGGLKDELEAALDACAENDEVLGLIITGSGKSFSAGADLEEVAKMKAADPVEGTNSMRERTQRLYLKLYRFPKPVVAAVNGYAFGGGAELTLVCDFRIASEKAVFGLPEVKMALMPGFGGTQMLPRVVGQGTAKEILMSGRSVGAEEGKRIGLYLDVVPAEELLSRAEELLRPIVKNGPIAVRCIKQSVNEGIALPVGSAFALENELCGIPSGSEDAKEGSLAFREKREPVFRNR